MTHVVALLGDCDAHDRLRSALAGYATIAPARSSQDLAHLLATQSPSVLVLDLWQATQDAVRDAVRTAHEANPRLRILIASKLEPGALRALLRLRSLAPIDVVVLDHESSSTVRERILTAECPPTGPEQLQALLAANAPTWLMPLVQWCLNRKSNEKATVEALATSLRMRRERLTRSLIREHFLSPSELLAQLTVLRAASWLQDPAQKVERTAYILGLYSESALRRFVKRHAKLSIAQLRARPLALLTREFLASITAQAALGGDVGNDPRAGPAAHGRRPHGKHNTPPRRRDHSR